MALWKEVRLRLTARVGSGKSRQVARKGGPIFDNSGTNVGKTLRKIPDQIIFFPTKDYDGSRKAFIIGSSYEERIGDALAPRGEEGRGRLR